MAQQNTNPYLFQFCCSQPSRDEQQTIAHKPDKISLRRYNSKIFCKKLQKQTANPESTILIKKDIPQIQLVEPIKFRPKIRFNWVSPELNRTTKQSSRQLSPKSIQSIKINKNKLDRGTIQSSVSLSAQEIEQVKIKQSTFDIPTKQLCRQLSPKEIPAIRTQQNKKQLNFKKLKQCKSSLLSIRSEGSRDESKGQLKLQQSLVVVNFFNPTKTQLSTMSKYLDRDVKESIYLSPAK